MEKRPSGAHPQNNKISGFSGSLFIVLSKYKIHHRQIAYQTGKSATSLEASPSVCFILFQFYIAGKLKNYSSYQQILNHGSNFVSNLTHNWNNFVVF